ncbi:MAG: putative membrane protein [Candidatus Woesebacteria bacterium GW2011_GWD1_38_10]|uniref:Putative membrane protein n=3 Tax=Candidatus Woeseibacteriota TaxID=1752722 RepID=A0A0G0P219_9BACT|nr:MAG: putative membrane protein [Candidatus Woesebacteria bacterium GW2011_GWD1_38_10]KKQ83366.1 MAG: putative membrane protein [Candidatus Woesebacteria bacterium GW2011_GWA1_38_8]
MNTIWLAFLTGLTSGGISCIAVQGGLLTSAISNTENTKNNKGLVMTFLISKTLTYTFLGFLLGYIGAFLVLTPKVSAVFQIFIGLFLLATAGRILDLHPIFRYFVIQPPKFIYKLAKNNTNAGTLFAPILLGALTVLMPCGVTQAMMVVALGTANPVQSALIMLAFVLGTSPVFFALGISVSKLIKYKAFNFISAGVIAVFAIISLNGAMGLLGSAHTLQNYWKAITGNIANTQIKSAAVVSGFQEATIIVKNNGYTSDVTTLKVDVPVRLKIITDNVYSCSRSFTVPGLNISKVLPATGEEIIEFTPTKTGRLAYSCSMGMYTGSFEVVK